MTLSLRSGVLRSVLGLTLAAVVAGCENPADQNFDAPLQLLDEVSLSEFESQVGAGAVRVEITVDPEELLARRIEIQFPEALADEEAITSQIVGLEIGNGSGHLTLRLGDLVVGFNAETRLELPNGDETDLDAFVGRVLAALAEGAHPPVKVERPAQTVPQDPDDPAFDATRIRLLQERHRPEIEITVDPDNLTRNDPPPPDGWLTVFGLPLEIRISEGLTEIGVERPDLERVEFEGVVQSVDLERRSFTLEDGTVVKLVDQSDIALSDHMPRFERLRLVAEAIDAGLTVVAAGVGAVESRDPLVLIALKLRFGLRHAELAEFRGLVESVSVEDLAFKMGDGTVVRLLSITHIAGDGTPAEVLERVQAAIADGKEVHVHGVGIEVDEDPRIIVALKLEFGPRNLTREFDGPVASADAVERLVKLEDGTIIKITDDTQIHQSDDPHVLNSLEEVVRALEAGEHVLTKGVGTVEPSLSTTQDPIVISALRIVFVLRPPPIEHFRGVVATVHLDRRALELEDGTTVRLDDDTKIHQELGDARVLGSLQEVADALDAGITVLTGGFGLLESDDPTVILAREIVFVVQPPEMERFEGVVVRVSVGDGVVKLGDETVVLITPDTKFHVNDENPGLLGSLEEVAKALEHGHTVVAVGIGTLVGTDPRTIEAAEVAFIVRPTDAVVFFEGVVKSVDVTQSTVDLTNGNTVKLTSETQIVMTDHTLGSLEDVEAAVAGGATVVTAGIGHRIGPSPGVIVAIQVLFVVTVP